MFDSNVGVCVPSHVVRFGRAHHGLLKVHGIHQPSGFLSFKGEDLRMVTRGGIEMTPPMTSIEKSQTGISPKPYGPVCLYMHPLATMEAESEHGIDWSGYAVFGLKPQDAPLISQPLHASFAFTPDDNSQAMLLSGNLVKISAPLSVDSSDQPASKNIAWPALLQYVNFRDFVFHATTDGRRYYAFQGPTFRQVAKAYQGGGAQITTTAASAEISGGMVGADIKIEVTPVAVAEPPPYIYTTESRDNTLWGSFRAVPIAFDGCVIDGESLTPEIIINKPRSELSAGAAIYAITSEDYITAGTRTAPVFAAVVAGEVEYVMLEIYEDRKREAVGDITGEFIWVNGDPCATTYAGPLDGFFPGEGTRSEGIATTTGVETLTQRVTLSGFGATSICQIEDKVNYTDIKEFGYPPRYESTNTITATVDGEVVASEAGYETIAGDGSVNISVSGWNVDGIGVAVSRSFIETGEGFSGKKWLRITVDRYDYGSADAMALAVIVERGTIREIVGSQQRYRIDPATYSGSLHIGKTFGRGFVDDLTTDRVLTADGVYCYRAYDPLTNSLSGVYDHPVFYF